MNIRKFIFGIFLLCALLIPTSAFASTGATTTNITYNQDSFDSIINQVLSFFFGNNNSNDGGNSNGGYYSGDDCGYNPPPCESDEIWKRWYCGGGQWGSF